jgi:hypothetical protein
MSTSSQDEFGAGIFDSEAEAPIELTAREIAIAKGEDPDAINVEETNEVEDGQSESQEEVETSDDASVFSDSDRELANKYGITEDELAEFGTSAALQRAVSVIERASKKDGITNESASDAADGGVVAKDAAESVAKNDEDKWAIEKIDPNKFSEDEYDEETLSLVKSLRKTQDALEQAVGYIKSQQQAAEQEAAAKNVKVFHDTLDTMPDEFGVSIKDGKPVKLTEAQEAARIKVRDAAETIYAGLIARNVAIPSVEEVIKQAITMVNGVARKSADRRQALVEQSAMRRSTGTTAAASRRKPSPPADGTTGSIASHPDVDRFWREAQEANGVY